MAQRRRRCPLMETTREPTSAVLQPHPGFALEVLRVSTRLGGTSFGGPLPTWATFTPSMWRAANGSTSRPTSIW